MADRLTATKATTKTSTDRCIESFLLWEISTETGSKHNSPRISVKCVVGKGWEIYAAQPSILNHRMKLEKPDAETKKAPCNCLQGAFLKSGSTYFRTGGHYHRLRKLNCCVRDGNRCDLSDKFTGMTSPRVFHLSKAVCCLVVAVY